MPVVRELLARARVYPCPSSLSNRRDNLPQRGFPRAPAGSSAPPREGSSAPPRDQKFPSIPIVQVNRDSRPPRRSGINALATTIGPPGVRNFIPNDP